MLTGTTKAAPGFVAFFVAPLLAFSAVIDAQTVAPNPNPNARMRVAPANPTATVVAPAVIVRRYARSEVPPPMYRRVKLSEEFQWILDSQDNPDTVTYPEAKWIKLHFLDQTNLGKHTTITITSEEDGKSQTLNTATLGQWNFSSALFNGDSVKITVNAAPGERDIRVVVQEVTIGIPPPPPEVIPHPPEVSATPPPVSLCHSDNRIPSSDSAVGRVLNITCTGWIISNGAHLTAGHCDPVLVNTLEFQVPLSDKDGSINVSAPENQYPIFGLVSNGVEKGNDWAIFAVHPNTETKLLPAQQQKAFYRLTDQITNADVIVRGYGSDNDEHGNSISTGWQNKYSFTLQSRQAPFNTELVILPSQVKLKYSAYLRGGDSGAPVIDSTNMLAIGINTNRCVSDSYAVGTGFKNSALKIAIETFPGPDTVYVDHGHPDPAEDGSIFRPYEKIVDGLNAVPDGGILSIVTGSYAVPPGTVIDDPVMLTAPVGPVIITAN